MAGGSTWRVRRIRDGSRLFQKEENGPWFLQKRFVVEITRKVKGSDVDVSPSSIGSESGTMTFVCGTTVKSRTASKGKYILRENEYAEIDEAMNWMQQNQIWEWIEYEDDAKELDDGSGA